MAIIRSLQKEDQDKISHLFPQLAEDFSVLNIDKLLSDKAVTSLIIEENGDIAGFGALVTYYLPSAGKMGNIEDIVVDEKYRGRGFGRMLMEKLIFIARENNIIELQLTSNPKREVARALYANLGFKIKDTDVFVLDL
jgi:phosphinothricin acetyltransferase